VRTFEYVEQAITLCKAFTGAAQGKSEEELNITDVQSNRHIYQPLALYYSLAGRSLIFLNEAERAMDFLQPALFILKITGMKQYGC